jgi:hypothetical protein
MDVEGAEIAILEDVHLHDYDIDKLVFEYHFDVDKSIPRFANIIVKLRDYFDWVHFTKVDLNKDTYDHFPRCTMVYCSKSTSQFKVNDHSLCY